MAVGKAASLWPPSRSALLGPATWVVTAIPNESPFLAFYWIGASTLLAFSDGDLHGVLAWVALGLAAATFVGTPVLVRRSLRAAPAIEQALDRAIGPRWRRAGGLRSIAPSPPWGRILFAPLPLFHPGVRRISNLSYGDAGRRNRLDLYRRRRGGSGGPVLIHLHGGRIVLAGSSFGARLATLAGFTTNDPVFSRGSNRPTRPSQRSSRSTATTAALPAASRCPPRRLTTSSAALRRFLSSMATGTLSPLHSALACWRSEPAAPPPNLSSTPSCPAPSTRSTSSARSASRQSLTASKPSQHTRLPAHSAGSVRDRTGIKALRAASTGHGSNSHIPSDPVSGLCA